MTYRYADEAEAELTAHLEYVAVRSPAAARRILDEVTRTVEALAAREYDGPEEQLLTGEIVRRWTGRTLIVYYQRELGLLRVLRVFDPRRRPIVKRMPR